MAAVRNRFDILYKFLGKMYVTSCMCILLTFLDIYWIRLKFSRVTLKCPTCLIKFKIKLIRSWGGGGGVNYKLL
jgi:hypothetical protein